MATISLNTSVLTIPMILTMMKMATVRVVDELYCTTVPTESYSCEAFCRISAEHLLPRCWPKIGVGRNIQPLTKNGTAFAPACQLCRKGGRFVLQALKCKVGTFVLGARAAVIHRLVLVFRVWHMPCSYPDLV